MVAHAALVNSEGIVIDVHVVANNDLDANGTFPDSEPSLRAFQSRLGLDRPGCIWYQCSYSGSFRGCFPSPGWKYDRDADIFLGPSEIAAP